MTEEKIEPDDQKASWWLGCITIAAIVFCIACAVVGSLILDSPIMMEVVK